MSWESVESVVLALRAADLPEPPLDPRRAEAIRRRAHAVLEGRVPARPHPAELALVVVFSIGLVVWALAAIVQPVA